MSKLQTSMNNSVLVIANKIMMYMIQNSHLWSYEANEYKPECNIFIDIRSSDVHFELNEYSHEFKTKVYVYMNDNYNIKYINENMFYIKVK
jgi:hypothetical protein